MQSGPQMFTQLLTVLTGALARRQKPQIPILTALRV